MKGRELARLINEYLDKIDEGIEVDTNKKLEFLKLKESLSSEEILELNDELKIIKYEIFKKKLSEIHKVSPQPITDEEFYKLLK